MFVPISLPFLRAPFEGGGHDRRCPSRVLAAAALPGGDGGCARLRGRTPLQLPRRNVNDGRPSMRWRVFYSAGLSGP